ncbi:hypothetical protein ILUMI_21359 [Ignelater luminosus]|uniref:Uncharacterized protein n=1 Tax=Ignelater luminosus TaxID=2038154 RepID=A0A8K0CFS2_IGNLU|nr:hypothetical protein ILUMI_21359 [Ignelater luminosus]
MLVFNKIIVHIIVVLLLFKSLHAQECNVSNGKDLTCKNIKLEADDHLPLKNTTSKLEKVIFNDCSIPTIHENAFLPVHTVTEIDLSYVHLRFLEEGTFNGLENLEVLDLNNNNIRKIQFGIFNSLTKLRKLNIHYNEINEIEEQSFANMVKLETLRVGWNKLRIIPKNVFKDLPNLKHLFFNNNLISRLPAGTLTNLPQLLQLNVEDNGLTTIEYGSITNITNLQHLQAENNKLSIIHESIFYGLTKITDLHINNNTLIKLDIDKLLSYTPNLKNIELNNNNWTCDSLFNMITQLQHKHVTILDNNTEFSSNVMGIACKAENDKLEAQSRVSSEGCEKNGETWTCRNIYLETDKKLPISDIYLSVKNIKFENCVVPTIPTGVFNSLQNIIDIDLERNEIETIMPGALDELKLLNRLHLRSNKITEIKVKTLNSLVNLKELNLHFNQISKLENECFSNMTRVELLRLGWNKLEYISENIFLGLKSLKHLFLNNNRITRLAVGSFRNLPSLYQLDIEHNLLTSLEFGTISKCDSLNILALSFNNLTNVNENIFYGFGNLHTLKISNNNISSLDVQKLLTYTPNLQKMSLNNNSWLCNSLAFNIQTLRLLNITITDNDTEIVTNFQGIKCIVSKEITTENVDILSRLEKILNDKLLNSSSLQALEGKSEKSLGGGDTTTMVAMEKDASMSLRKTEKAVGISRSHLTTKNF